MDGYRFLDHMTDAVIEAYGPTLENAFENAAKGLNDTMVDLKDVKPDRQVQIQAEGHDLENLLFEWLDKVMLLLVSDGIVMSDFKVKIEEKPDGYRLLATAYGEKLDLRKHSYKVEIKAVTYHEMMVKKDLDGYTLRFLLDL